MSNRARFQLWSASFWTIFDIRGKQWSLEWVQGWWEQGMPLHLQRITAGLFIWIPGKELREDKLPPLLLYPPGSAFLSCLKDHQGHRAWTPKTNSESFHSYKIFWETTVEFSHMLQFSKPKEQTSSITLTPTYTQLYFSYSSDCVTTWGREKLVYTGAGKPQWCCSPSKREEWGSEETHQQLLSSGAGLMQVLPTY